MRRLGVGGLAPGGEVEAVVGEVVLGPDPPDDRQRLVEELVPLLEVDAEGPVLARW